MKILQIIYSLGSGGAERFVVDLSNELARQGQDVTLCTLRDDTEDDFGFYKQDVSVNVKYINYKFKPGFNPFITWPLYKLIKKIKPDVIHCHQGLLFYLLPIIPFFKSIHFFYTIHTVAHKEIESKFALFLRSFFFRRNLVKAITISDETSQSFIDCYHTNNFTQIENGRKKELPSPYFEQVKNEIESYKNGEKTVFIHVASCLPVKNQEMLISVFNSLINDNLPIILLILGVGFDSEKGLLLQQKAKKGIYFLGQKHNVVDYYMNASAFCLTSNYEGLPISLIEALSYGCTPICTPVGGIINVIQNTQTGYLSLSTSENDYKKAVQTYLKNKDHISSSDLIEYYYKNYSIEICSEKHILLYQA